MMHASPHKPRRNDDGVALILVLMLIVLLGVIVAEFGYESQVEASLTADAGRSFAAYVAAKSAVAAGFGALHGDLLQQQMMGEVNQNIRNVKETINRATQKNNKNGEQPGQQDPYGEGGMENYDGCTDLWYNPPAIPPIGEAEATCWVTDECGKLNLNALVDIEGKVNEFLAETLRVLFRNCDADEAIVDSIIEWLTPGELAGGGSFDTSYGAKHGPMDSIEELLLVPGITPALYFDLNEDEPDTGLFSEEAPPHWGLPDLLTVRGDPTGVININTIQAPLLEALMEAAGGASVGDAVQLVEELRMEPVRSVQELSSRFGVDLQEANNIDVKSNFFRIQGDGRAENTFVRIEAYVFRNPEQMMEDGTYDNGRNQSGKEGKQPPKQPKPESGGDTGGDTETGGRQDQQGGMLEPFKILDWRVIR